MLHDAANCNSKKSQELPTEIDPKAGETLQNKLQIQPSSSSSIQTNNPFVPSFSTPFARHLTKVVSSPSLPKKKEQQFEGCNGSLEKETSTGCFEPKQIHKNPNPQNAFTITENVNSALAVQGKETSNPMIDGKFHSVDSSIEKTEMHYTSNSTISNAPATTTFTPIQRSFVHFGPQMTASAQRQTSLPQSNSLQLQNQNFHSSSTPPQHHQHHQLQQQKIFLLNAPWPEKPLLTAPSNPTLFSNICSTPLSQIMHENTTFLQYLFRFLTLWNATLPFAGRIPEVFERPVDLHKLFALVVASGGFRVVGGERKWPFVAVQLLGNVALEGGNEHLMLVLRWIYGKMLFLFEQAVHWKIPPARLMECLVPNIWPLVRSVEKVERIGNDEEVSVVGNDSLSANGNANSSNANTLNESGASTRASNNSSVNLNNSSTAINALSNSSSSSVNALSNSSNSLYNPSSAQKNNSSNFVVSLAQQPESSSSPFVPAFNSSSSSFTNHHQQPQNFLHPKMSPSQGASNLSTKQQSLTQRQSLGISQKPSQSSTTSSSIPPTPARRQNPLIAELEVIKNEFLSGRSLIPAFAQQIPFKMAANSSRGPGYTDYGRLNAKKLKLSLFSGCMRDVVYSLNALATLSLVNSPSLRGIEWIFDVFPHCLSIPTAHTLVLLCILRNICAVGAPEEIKTIASESAVVEMLFSLVEHWPSDHPISINCVHLLCSLSGHLENAPSSFIRVLKEKLQKFSICSSPVLFFNPKDYTFTSFTHEWLRANVVRDYKILSLILSQWAPCHSILTCLCNLSDCISQKQSQEIALHIWRNFLVPVLLGPLYKFTLGLRLLLEHLARLSSSSSQSTTEMFSLWLRGTLLADAFGYSDFGNIENALEFIICIPNLPEFLEKEQLEEAGVFGGLIKVFLELVRSFSLFDCSVPQIGGESSSGFHSRPFGLAMKLGQLLLNLMNEFHAMSIVAYDGELEFELVQLITRIKNVQLASLLATMLSLITD